MPFRDTPYRFPNNQRNQFVLVEQREFGRDFGGAPFAIYEETIPQGSAPDVGTFGIFEPYVYNERNHTQSRHRFVQIDVNAAAITFRYRTADDGSVLKETREVVPVNTALPAGSLNLLNATRQRMDGNHEMMVKETLETFPIINGYEQASDSFGGLDVKVSRQRVASAEPGNLGVEGVSAEGETAERMQLRKIEVTTPAGLERVTLRDWVPSLQASQVMRTVEVVGTNDNPSATYLDVAIQDKKIAIGKKLRTRFSVAAWLDFVDYEVDSETNEPVTVTRRIRDKATFVYAKEARVEIEAKQLDHLRVLETRKELSSAVFGKSFKNTRNIQYRFPGWLVPGQEYYIYDNIIYSGATISYIAGLNEKPGQTLTVPATTYTSYHPSRPLAPEVFQFFTSSITANVDNEFLSQLAIASTLDKDVYTLLRKQPIVINDLIVNETPAVWRAYKASASLYIHVLSRTQPTWIGAVYGGSWTYTKVLDLPESKPNASLYVQMMQEAYEVLVGVEIEQWKYNLWRQTRTYIKIPNLMTPGLAGL
jgi:hypothetical protein